MLNIVPPPTPLHAPNITVQAILKLYTIIFHRSTITVQTFASILQIRNGEAEGGKKEKLPFAYPNMWSVKPNLALA